MRARRVACVFAVLAAGASHIVPNIASAEPKPAAVDIKPFRGELLVFQDAAGGTYAVRPGADPRAFYGTGKVLYEQVVTGRSANGDAWSVSIWAPRIPDLRSAAIVRRAD